MPRSGLTPPTSHLTRVHCRARHRPAPTTPQDHHSWPAAVSLPPSWPWPPRRWSPCSPHPPWPRQPSHTAAAAGGRRAARQGPSTAGWCPPLPRRTGSPWPTPIHAVLSSAKPRLAGRFGASGPTAAQQPRRAVAGDSSRVSGRPGRRGRSDPFRSARRASACAADAFSRSASTSAIAASRVQASAAGGGLEPAGPERGGASHRRPPVATVPANSSGPTRLPAPSPAHGATSGIVRRAQAVGGGPGRAEGQAAPATDALASQAAYIASRATRPGGFDQLPASRSRGTESPCGRSRGRRRPYARRGRCRSSRPGSARPRPSRSCARLPVQVDHAPGRYAGRGWSVTLQYKPSYLRRARTARRTWTRAPPANTASRGAASDNAGAWR